MTNVHQHHPNPRFATAPYDIVELILDFLYHTCSPPIPPNDDFPPPSGILHPKLTSPAPRLYQKTLTSLLLLNKHWRNNLGIIPRLYDAPAFASVDILRKFLGSLERKGKEEKERRKKEREERERERRERGEDDDAGANGSMAGAGGVKEEVSGEWGPISSEWDGVRGGWNGSQELLNVGVDAGGIPSIQTTIIPSVYQYIPVSPHTPSTTSDVPTTPTPTATTAQRDVRGEMCVSKYEEPRWRCPFGRFVRILDLSMVRFATSDHLRTLADHVGESVRVLDLRNNGQVTDSAVVYLLEQARQRLTHLSLEDNHQITDFILSSVSRLNERSLIHVRLARCGRITNEGFADLSRHGVGLKSLELVGMRNLGDKVLNRYARRQQLRIDRAVQAMLSQMEQQQARGSPPGDGPLQEPTNPAPEENLVFQTQRRKFQNQYSLERFALHRCTNLSNESLINFARTNAGLRHLSISISHSVNVRTLMGFANFCPLEELSIASVDYREYTLALADLLSVLVPLRPTLHTLSILGCIEDFNRSSVDAILKASGLIGGLTTNTIFGEGVLPGGGKAAVGGGGGALKRLRLLPENEINETFVEEFNRRWNEKRKTEGMGDGGKEFKLVLADGS
ncbi:hypothetical protein HK102_002859 [Quaeritorhiza haematococci]|nr:hypothetical protein HK102_002859 [Quaeritorhiza haematococci]